MDTGDEKLGAIRLQSHRIVEMALNSALARHVQAVHHPIPSSALKLVTLNRLFMHYDTFFCACFLITGTLDFAIWQQIHFLSFFSQ